MNQNIITAESGYGQIDRYLYENGLKTILLVCDSSIGFLKINDYFKNLEGRTGVKIVRFNKFQPNPLYESVVEGVTLLHQKHCEGIIAVGGGSAIDVAKCIKLYSNMDPSLNYLEQDIIPNNMKLLAVPTTAGTGSEATRFAVIYYQGVKQSVTHTSIIPDTVLLDSSVLKTLPLYQKKSTMMDALCHSIESFWSINSTTESKEYSDRAIRSILYHKDAYLANEEAGNAAMLLAANMAGKAINITQTTAGHAMCYKLTSLYGIAHGHAAALCDKELMSFMAEHTDRCIDKRGEAYLKQTFQEIAEAMGCNDFNEACGKFKDIFKGLELATPIPAPEDYESLRTSVNPTRLKNHPIALDEDTIDMLYHRILEPKN